MTDKYNYTALFEDGAIISKTEDDTSVTDKSKSRFFDVTERAKEVKLISFVLHNETHSWGVDLRDGHFEVNGVPFFQHKAQDYNVTDLRLIFYKTSQRHIQIESGQDLGGGVICYTLGWQGTVDGKNVQKVIVIPN